MAPTVKLHDDAPVRVPTPVPGAMNLGHLPTPAPGSMSYPPRPASIPPQNNNPASIPPQNNPISRPPSAPVTGPPSQPPRRASTPAPTAVSSPSLSMIAPKRSGAMIAVVLVLDLALAAAGATMLVKGLAKPKAADAKPASTATHAQTDAPTPAAAAPAPAAAAPVAAAVADPPAPPPPPAANEKTAARDPKRKPTATKPDSTKKAGDGGPLDPYAGAPPPPPAADQSAEIETLARQSFGSFRRCFDDAIHGSPIHGDIRIAFVVQPDGHVDHASPVVNTTGSDTLASCLAQTIGTWTLAPHAGAAATYERPFNYP